MFKSFYLFIYLCRLCIFDLVFRFVSFRVLQALSHRMACPGWDSGSYQSCVYLTRKSSYDGTPSSVPRPGSWVLFLVFRSVSLCSSIRGGTKRTIACFDCGLQLSCSLRSSLGRRAWAWASSCWLPLCTCDNIFIIFASFSANIIANGRCVCKH